MDLRDFVRLLRRNWILVLALFVFTTGLALAYTKAQTPLYAATAKAYVSTESASSVNDLTAGSDFTQQIVKSYADIATMPYVLDDVISTLGLDTTPTKLAKQVTTSAVSDEAVLQVVVTDPEPQQAVRIADTITTQLADAVGTLTPSGRTALVKVTQVQPAIASEAPVSPSLPLNLVLGAVIGLVLGLGLALLRQRLDTRIRSITDVSVVTPRPILGRILRDADQRPLDLSSNRWSARAEAFRALRTNLEFLEFDDADEDAGRSLVITSSVAGEGKTTTAANLAIAMSNLGEQVLLIDADLRRPRLAEYLAIDGSIGLTDVLVHKADLDDAVQEWGPSRLAVLPAGTLAPNPSELLQGRSMVDLLQRVRERYTVVILDTPPLLPVTDAAILARRVDGAIVVAAARRARRPDLRAALEVLDQVSARVLGVVVTMLPKSGPDADPSTGRYSAYGEALGPGQATA